MRMTGDPMVSSRVAPAAWTVLQQRFTAPKLYNLWPQASLHTQWNGTGVMGDPNLRMTGDPMVSSRVAPAAWTVDCWWVAELRNSTVENTYSAELLQQRFTAPKLYNLWPQASLHTQWNGTRNSNCRNLGRP
jgi:hypothetical protein